MISRCGLMQRKDGMAMEDFKDYWLHVHGPIAAEMAHLRQYDQHAMVQALAVPGMAEGPVSIDGYSELQFDSYGDMREGVASLNGKGVDDIPKFANPRCRILVMAKRAIVKVPAYLRDTKLVQCVAFLGRAEGVCSARFDAQWWNVHDRLMQTVPGFVGYNQNLIIDRIDGGVSVPYRALPVEAVAELWFETKGAFEEFCASPEFARVRAHGAEFIGSVNAYLTETYPVVRPRA